jgi:hypothetical protein
VKHGKSEFLLYSLAAGDVGAEESKLLLRKMQIIY